MELRVVGQPVAPDSSGRDPHPASPGEPGAEGSLPTPAPVPRTRETLVLLRREQREGRTTPGGGWALMEQAELEGALGCLQGCMRC